MKPPKIVCAIAAPVITLIEASAIAAVAYGIYFVALKVLNLLIPPVNAIYQRIPFPDVSFLQTPEAKNVLATSVLSIGGFCIAVGAIYLIWLWVVYNRDHCQDFWTRHVEEAKPVPLIGVVKQKPPHLLCVVGSPLLTICELAVVGTVVYLAIRLIEYVNANTPQPEPAPMMTYDQYQAYLANQRWWANLGDNIAHVVLGLIALAIFVLWSKWNYTLCQRFWNR